MEVRLFPNARRPGVGLKPRRDGQRPFLPQHARHCPVLEAGSSLGFLVYPPLSRRRVLQHRVQRGGALPVRVLREPAGSKEWLPIFSVTVVMPVGGIGTFREEVALMTQKPAVTREEALHTMRTFIVPEDLGTPPGGLTLRGAWNFQTPQGWDSVYTPVFNMIERPIAPMLIVRVETDWYMNETEFRYVLQPGEMLSGAPQPAHRPGAVRAARGGVAADVQRRGTGRDPRHPGRVRHAEGGPQSDHLLRDVVQPPLPAIQPRRQAVSTVE